MTDHVRQHVKISTYTCESTQHLLIDRSVGFFFVQSSFVLRYACAPAATRGYLTTAFALLWLSFFFLFFGGVAFSEYFLYHYRFLLVWKVRRTFFPSGWCFSTFCQNPLRVHKVEPFVKIQPVFTR